VLTAFSESEGDCIVDVIEGKQVSFNNRFELDGITFLEPTHQLFNYNNPYGACPSCEGYGRVIGIDPKKVIPDETKSVYDGGVACWRGEKNGRLLDRFIEDVYGMDFPVHRPYNELTKKQLDLLWHGDENIFGINDFFSELETKTYKIQNRVRSRIYQSWEKEYF